MNALPVLSALRKAHPDSEIGVAVEERLAPLLEGHPCISRLHAVPRERRRGLSWWKRLGGLGALHRELRSSGYRASVDLAGLTWSARLGKKSGAAVRVGFAAPEGRQLSSWYYTVRIVPSPRLSHVSERNLSLLVPLAVRREEPSFVFPDLREARSALANSLGDPARTAVLHVGADWPSKLWPPEHFAALAERIASELSLEVLVTWWGDLERSRAEAIARMAHGRARVAPALDLRELAALVGEAKVSVGADTGPLHLAWTQGAPTVMLFGPTKLERTGPRSPRARACRAALGCVGCMRPRCPDGTDACMRGIRPDEVFELVRSAVS